MVIVVVVVVIVGPAVIIVDVVLLPFHFICSQGMLKQYFQAITASHSLRTSSLLNLTGVEQRRPK